MDYIERTEKRQQLNNVMYYIIVGVVSILSSVFLPLVNSSLETSLQWPTTKTGWFVFIISKLAIALINIIILVCFLEQAKINIKDNAKYLEAREMLNKIKLNKKYIPRSPRKYTATTWTYKGTTLLIGSLLSVVAFSNAILNFDLTVFLASTFTVIIGIAFSYLQMKKDEEYWTSEFWHYAKWLQNKELNEVQNDININVSDNKDINNIIDNENDENSDKMSFNLKNKEKELNE